MKTKISNVLIIIIISIVVTLFVTLQIHSITPADLTRAQAVARVNTILRNNAGRCRITKTQSVSAVRVKAGWRVTARIRMSASGTSRAETAAWIVSANNGAVVQDQLTAEIAIGCP